MVRGLEKLAIFSLLNIPASIRNNPNIPEFVKCYLVGIWHFLKSKETIYFYNFHKAYVILYVLHLVIHLKRPCLLLADGVNCFGLSASNFNGWSRLFSNIIMLPSVTTCNNRSNLIPFRGLADVYGTVERQELKQHVSTVLYNSSFIANNHPEELIPFATYNNAITIEVTGTLADFRDYLIRNTDRSSNSIPINIKFLGDLTDIDYNRKLQTIDAILIFRNEALFANQYNFPSKCIEAVKSRIPIISNYEITGLPDELYLLKSGPTLSPSDKIRVCRMSQTTRYQQIRQSFLIECDGLSLKKKLAEFHSRVIN